VHGGGGVAGAGDGGGGVVEELNIMINSVMKNQEPQMNADLLFRYYLHLWL